MHKILRLDMLSVVRLFVAFYAVIGIYAASRSALMGADSVLCPFGFEYPLSHATINLTINLPHPASWVTPFLVLIAIVFYAITGAISGIRNNQAQPFFLYFATHGIHEPRVPAKRFVGKSGAGVYGDQIEELDDSVGASSRRWTI